MRIISGKYKGKKILLPKDKFTRPLRDLVKESIFNILKHSNLLICKIDNANILDLFSGTGSFGLECASRGASNVTFFENYKPAINILKKNINILDCQHLTKVINKDISIKELKKLNKFDLIFLDPPFKYENVNQLIIDIKKSDLLKKNGLIILHRHKNDNKILSEKYKIIKKKNVWNFKYLLWKLVFLEKNFFCFLFY